MLEKTGQAMKEQPIQGLDPNLRGCPNGCSFLIIVGFRTDPGFHATGACGTCCWLAAKAAFTDATRLFWCCIMAALCAASWCTDAAVLGGTMKVVGRSSFLL